LNRVLVIDKPAGMTSHDVVARVRRVLRTRRVGHTGTLDPAATGVLIVLVGKATRLAQFFVDLDKEYRGRMTLGVETDTQDAEGAVVARRDASGVTRRDVERALEGFVGGIEQVPPMVSALKRGGTPLYVLARRGEVVEREARAVRVDRFRMLSFEPPEVEFELACSRGTYVRTLAADVGGRLGCGAHLSALVRTRVGPFGVEQALSLEEVGAARVSLPGLSMFEALPFMPDVRVSGREAEALSTGAAIELAVERLGSAGRGGELGDAGVGTAGAGHVRLSLDGVELLGVGRVVGTGGAGSAADSAGAAGPADGGASDAAGRTTADSAGVTPEDGAERSSGGTAVVRPVRVFVDPL